MSNKIGLKNGQNIVMFDIIRCFACLGVVLFHLTTRYSELYGNTYYMPVKFSYGYSMVIVFLLMSGFFMYKSKNISAVQLLTKKFLRLFPCYIASLMIIYPITSLLLPSRSVSFLDFLINFTTLNGLINIPYVDGAHWTIYVEIVFIIIVLFISLLKINPSKQKIVLLTIDIVCLLLVILNDYYDNSIIKICYKLIQAKYIGVLCTGFVCASLIGNRIKTVDVGIIVISFATQMFSRDMANIIVFVVTCGFMICIAYSEKMRNIKINLKVLKPMTFISGISYPLYLIHQNISYSIMLNIQDVCKPMGEFVIIIPLVICITLAYLLHKFIEIPCIKLYRNKIGKSEKVSET